MLPKTSLSVWTGAHMKGWDLQIYFRVESRYVLDSPGSHLHKCICVLVVVMSAWIKCRNLISDTKLQGSFKE